MRRPVSLLLSTLCCLLPAFMASADDGLRIGQVQGADVRSPRVGERVVVAGTVTMAATGPRRGWFVQDSGDGDPATSDAIFIEADGATERVPVAIGADVRVHGTVAELDAGGGATLTALRGVEIGPSAKPATPRPKPIRVATPPADWERYEGMRVRIAAPLTVAGTHRLERYGELVVNFGDRLATPSDVAAPGEPARALAAANARRTLRIDDGSTAERPETVWYLPAAGAPRTGTRMSGLEGVVDQRGGYLLLPTRAPRFAPPPSPKPPKVGGDVRVAAFNLENFFNGDGQGGGFPTPRGARTPAEFDAQLGRLVATIRGLDPDIAALMELENDGFGPESALARLVDALNATGDADWRFVATRASQGDDQIRVGLIYRVSRVAPVGEAATLTDDLFGSRSRPPLAQSFRAGAGPVFTVVANHFKSKGCGEASGADADRKDGQGCWNAVRTESARRLDAWLHTDPTRSGSDLAMIVGDLNAYTMEDPVRALVAAGWRDAFAGQRGPTPYSYVYDGQIGRLDHALLSPALAARLAGAAEWHSNADEPEARGYRARPGQRGPWRSSDHDPLIVGLRLRRP
ncbi:MAG: ExeM/NucH family extracellular endonuclease [Pseudomonadota bacterium]